MILKTTCSGWILLRLYLQFGELPSPSSAPCFCLVRQFSPLRLKIGVVSDFVALSFVAEMTKFGEKVTLDSETKLSDQRLWEVRSDQVVVNEWHKKHVVCRARLNGPWLTWWNELTTKSFASLILPMHFLFSFLLLHFLAHLPLLLKYCFKLSWIPPPPPALSLKTFRWPVFIIADREASYFPPQHLSKTIKSNQNVQSVNHFRHFYCSQL